MQRQDALFGEVLEDDAPIPASITAPNNGKGRPKGARNRRHRALERVAQSEAIPLLQTVINAAKSGDMMAAKIILDRVWPRPRSAPINVDMPPTETPSDIRAAMHDLLSRVARGELTTEDGQALIAMMTDMLRAHSFEQNLPDANAGVTIDVRGTFAERLARVIEARQKSLEPPAGD